MERRVFYECNHVGLGALLFEWCSTHAAVLFTGRICLRCSTVVSAVLQLTVLSGELQLLLRERKHPALALLDRPPQRP